MNDNPNLDSDYSREIDYKKEHKIGERVSCNKRKRDFQLERPNKRVKR
jgi:hypothetical protein